MTDQPQTTNLEPACGGRCDGLGCYPVRNSEDLDGLDLVMWIDAHGKPDAHRGMPGGKCDGWHMVKCLACESARQ